MNTAQHDHERALEGRRARAQQGHPRTRGRFVCATAPLLATTMALAGCGPFSASATADSCVISAMKAAEPFGNAKERAETETQLRHFCKLAAGAA
jgi:hypothetical protein